MLEPISYTSVQLNPFTLLGKDLMLITAGTVAKWNTMTAAWGGMGYLWEKPVMFIFVRPSRYTYAFLEDAQGFTCSFFPSSWHEKLMYLGTHSGRDGEKTSKLGMRAEVLEPDRITFEGASLVFSCKKAAKMHLDKNLFFCPSIEPMYHGKDYHEMYVGAIDAVYRDQ